MAAAGKEADGTRKATTRMVVLGSREDRPDYAYEDQAQIRIYQLQDGKECSTAVPDLRGNPVLRVCAKRRGKDVLISVEGTHGELSVLVYEGENKREGKILPEEDCVWLQ